MSCQVTKCCASQMTNCTAKCNLTSCDQMLFSKMSCDVKSRLFSGSDFVFSRPSRRFLNEKLMHKRTKNSLFAEKSSQFQSDLRFFFFSLSLSLSLSLAATLCQFLQWFDKSIQIFSKLIHPSTTTKEKTEKEEKDFKARREVRKGVLFSSSSSIETFSIEEMLKLD